MKAKKSSLFCPHASKMIAVGFLLCGLPTAKASQLFSDITSAVQGMPRHGNAYIVDIDKDGSAEVIAWTDSTRIWKKQGDFNYVDITTVSGLDGIQVACAGDFDNDGFVDFLHTKSDPAEAVFFRNNQDGTFIQVPLPLTETQALLAAQELRVTDIDGDGDLDVVFGQAVGSSGSIICVLNQARNQGGLVQPFSGVTTLALTPWKNNKAEVTDANGDGKPDLLSIRTTGDWSSGTHPDYPVTLFLNTGSSPEDYVNIDGSRNLAGFTQIDDCGISAANVMSPLASWDIDNDGDQDLINGSSDWRWTSRPHIYINDGAGNYTQMYSPIYQSSQYYHHGISIFDADLDNDMDAVWTALHNFADIYPRMWRNDGELTFTDVTSAWGVTARIPGSGNLGMGGYHADLDGDGDIDFVVDMANGWGSEQVFAIYRNNAVENGANWLGVHLVASESAPNGIGARVEVTVDGRKLTQLMLDITGGVRNLTSLRFGLGASTTADSVKVYWPSGEVTDLTEVQGNQILAVRENADEQPLDSDGDGLSDAWEMGYGRYQVIQGNFTWEEAKADAEARGGHLATITSQEEQDFIVSLFEPELREGRSGTWIGAYQTSKADEPSGNWAWSNGEAWSFTNWNVAPDNYQGDQDYGYIIGDFPGFSKWDDAPLAGGYTRYLLEFGYPTDPFNADSDGDGFNDSIETHYKTDPNNASVTPNNSRPTGAVSQWVAPEASQSDVPSGLTDVVQVAAGGAGYALKSNGTVAAWGEIWSGSGSGNIPAYVPEGLSNVVQIDAGINYVLALKGDGTLVSWGHFWNGNSHQAAFVPEGLSGVVQISAGISHAVALKADGTIAVWGTNNWGQTDVPAGLSDVVQVEAGGYHTMAPKRDGTVVVWGGIHSQARDVPEGLSDVVKIAAGGHVCVALKSDGTVIAWGSDNLGGTDVPVGLADVVAVSASPHVATIALKQRGTAVSWGDQNNLPVVSGPMLAADAGWGRNIVLSAAPTDSDNDGIPDNYETNTGTWVSATETGTDPNNPDTDGDGLLDGVETNTDVYVSPDDTGTNPNLADTDGDGLSDGVETATWIYLDASDTGTDLNIADTDGDGLSDGVETNTGVFASASNTGSNPLVADTSGDGLHDGDLVASGYNPNTNYTQLFNLVKMKGAPTQEAIGLFTESSIMDLNLGGLTLRKSGNSVNLRLQLQTKSSLSNQWTNHSVVPLILDMPGNQGFMRVRALGRQ